MFFWYDKNCSSTKKSRVVRWLKYQLQLLLLEASKRSSFNYIWIGMSKRYSPAVLPTAQKTAQLYFALLRYLGIYLYSIASLDNRMVKVHIFSLDLASL